MGVSTYDELSRTPTRGDRTMLLLGERTPATPPPAWLNFVLVEEADVRTAALDVCIAAASIRCLF